MNTAYELAKAEVKDAQRGTNALLRDIARGGKP